MVAGPLSGDHDILRPMRRLLLLFAALAIVVAGCADSSSVKTTAAALDEVAGEVEVATTSSAEPGSDVVVPQESTTLPSNAVTPLGVPEPLEDFSFTGAWLDEKYLFIAVASTSEQRQQGLMHITDLGALNGMVFVFEEDTSGGFWMKNTLIPLDIAFFDVDGKFVDGFAMEPCTTADCPTYRPGGSYRFALEMPAGDMHPDPQVLVLGDQP